MANVVEKIPEDIRNSSIINNSGKEINFWSVTSRIINDLGARDHLPQGVNEKEVSDPSTMMSGISIHSTRTELKAIATKGAAILFSVALRHERVFRNDLASVARSLAKEVEQTKTLFALLDRKPPKFT